MIKSKSFKVVCNFRDVDNSETLIEKHLRLATANRIAELDLSLREAAKIVDMTLGKLVYQLEDSVAGGLYNFLVISSKLGIKGSFSLKIQHEDTSTDYLKYPIKAIDAHLTEYENLLRNAINSKVKRENISVRQLALLVGVSTTNIRYHLKNENGRSLQPLIVMAFKLNIQGEICLSLKLPKESN